MRLDQLNLKQARIWVKRSKNSLNTEQAIEGDELRAIKRYLGCLPVGRLRCYALSGLVNGNVIADGTRIRHLRKHCCRSCF